MLTGKTAVVTGGTRGIGFAIAKKFLENGANVAIAGSRQESVDKALAKLPEYAGRVMGMASTHLGEIISSSNTLITANATNNNFL